MIGARAGTQRGAALLMVILLVALMTVLAVNLVEGVRFNSQRVFNQRVMDQAYWYALGGEQIARLALEDAAEADRTYLGQDWARKDIVFPIDGGSIAGLVEDQQACFNVNTLYRPGDSNAAGEVLHPATAVLMNLLLNLDIAPQKAEEMADRVSDWVDEDFAPEGNYGAEDLYYSDQDTPFMPPNQAMVSVSELHLLADFDGDEWQRLTPYLCALPEVATAININTLLPAQAPLLAAALGNAVSVAQAQTALENRPNDGWPDVASLLSELVIPLEQQPSGALLDGLTVKSSYFRVLADVFYQQRQLRLYSRMVIKNNKAVAYAREYGDVF